MNPDDDLTVVWKALSDSTRRTILDLLRERPRTTGELGDAFDVSRFAVMKHLSILEQAELIVIRRSGRERWNYLNAVPLQRIYEHWLRPYESKWASALIRLKNHIEEAQAMTFAGETSLTTAVFKEIRIEQNVTIEAPPERVFDALTRDSTRWWSAPFVNTPGATGVVLEPKLGGHFFEDLGEGQGFLLGTVVLIKRPEALRIRGPMFLSGPAQGVIAFQFEPAAAGQQTLLKLSHRLIGGEDEVNEQFQAAFRAGWQELLGTRLKNFVEQGTRYDLLAKPDSGSE